MLVDERGGNIEGSVTGGCVEAALVEEAQRVFAGEAPRVVTYGISDEEAAGVGLMRGGTVRIFVHEQGEEALDALDAVAGAREPASRWRWRHCWMATAPGPRWRSSTNGWWAASW
jgi:xanthine dehydrogenase accessory factor